MYLNCEYLKSNDLEDNIKQLKEEKSKLLEQIFKKIQQEINMEKKAFQADDQICKPSNEWYGGMADVSIPMRNVSWFVLFLRSV